MGLKAQGRTFKKEKMVKKINPQVYFSCFVSKDRLPIKPLVGD